MVRMISITDLEDEIRMHEGVIVNINRRPLSNTYTVPSRVRSYIETYPKVLPDNAYVRQLAKRINVLLPKVSFHIVRKDGVTLYNRHSRISDFRISQKEEDLIS